MQQDFTWEPQHTKVVRSEFDKQAANQYSHHVNEWKQRWTKGKDKPKHLNSTVWEGFQHYWNLEKTKATSATNSRNRRSDRGGKGIATHNAGATTFEAREQELV